MLNEQEVLKEGRSTGIAAISSEVAHTTVQYWRVHRRQAVALRLLCTGQSR